MFSHRLARVGAPSIELGRLLSDFYDVNDRMVSRQMVARWEGHLVSGCQRPLCQVERPRRGLSFKIRQKLLFLVQSKPRKLVDPLLLVCPCCLGDFA